MLLEGYLPMSQRLPHIRWYIESGCLLSEHLCYLVGIFSVYSPFRDKYSPFWPFVVTHTHTHICITYICIHIYTHTYDKLSSQYSCEYKWTYIFVEFPMRLWEPLPGSISVNRTVRLSPLSTPSVKRSSNYKWVILIAYTFYI